jgi:hypothetical protein
MASDYRIGARVRITARSAMQYREGTLLKRLPWHWIVAIEGELPMAFQWWEMEVIDDR